MNYRTLGGGALACSAMVVYGWAQSSAPQGVDGCPERLVEGLTSLFSEKRTEQVQQNCSSNHLIPTITTAPEQIRSNPPQNNSRSTQLPHNVEKIYHQLLEQAHKAANRDRLAEAISSVASIPKNSQHYDTAQRLQEGWSQELMQRASNCYQRADLSMAMSMLNAIPQTSQRHARASELHDRWHQQAVILNQAIAAKEVGDWQGVINALKDLEGTQLYQTASVQALLEQATSSLFKPDQALLHLAAASTATDSTASVPIDMNRVAPLPVDPPPSSHLTIGVEQALEWARPPAQLQLSLPSKSPKQENAAMSHPFANSSLDKSSVPVSRSAAVLGD